jgi:large subunit ribosomal protein L21
MYAVIKTGGKQYRVAPDQTVEIERLPGEAGAKVTFGDVLLVGGEAGVRVGVPSVAGASVEGEILAQFKDDKVYTTKKKRRKSHHRQKNHRQNLTRVKILSIAA